jgi:hypothetical protein
MKEDYFFECLRRAYYLGKNDGWETDFQELANECWANKDKKRCPTCKK